MIPKDLKWQVCQRKRHFRLIFLIMIFLCALSLLSFPAVEPGSATHVVLVVDLIGIALIGLFSGYIVYFCNRWDA